MKPKRHPKPAPLVAAFWDTSAIVPLCLFQPQSARSNQSLRMYRRQITWWAAGVEAVSALNRLYREEILTKEEKQQAVSRLNVLRAAWNEIQPSTELRDGAERLLGIHKLRAADALQLSAALTWCRNRPRGRPFVVSDDNLADAAEAEGFMVVRVQ